MRVGGPAERVLIAKTPDELITHTRELWFSGDPFMLLGGGSNTIVSDEGYPGTVVLVRNEGIQEIAHDRPKDHIRLRVQAGHNWNDLVRYCVASGFSGVEALIGIPGSVGASPVQNIGAYGAELSDVLHSIEFLDATTGELITLPAEELDLGYRDSTLKQGRAGAVISVDIDLMRAPTALVRYDQLAQALGVELGSQMPLQHISDTVLALRAAKAMVLDDNDPDTYSAGSFFTNPIVTENFAYTLPNGAPKYPIALEEPPPAITTLEELANGVELRVPDPAPTPMVKLSAAWLIEHAGIAKGFRLPGSHAAISSKHTLAITNQGGASAHEVAELARFIVQRVQQEFGVILVPEPNLYGLEI